MTKRKPPVRVTAKQRAHKLSRRPKPPAPFNPLRTAADVKLWIEESVKADENGKPWTDETAVAAVLWWHAMEQASAFYELHTKEIASMLLDGVPPITTEAVDEELQMRFDDALFEAGGDGDEAEDDDKVRAAAELAHAAAVERDLRDHFGLT